MKERLLLCFLAGVAGVFVAYICDGFGKPASGLLFGACVTVLLAVLFTHSPRVWAKEPAAVGAIAVAAVGYIVITQFGFDRTGAIDRLWELNTPLCLTFAVAPAFGYLWWVIGRGVASKPSLHIGTGMAALFTLFGLYPRASIQHAMVCFAITYVIYAMVPAYVEYQRTKPNR